MGHFLSHSITNESAILMLEHAVELTKTSVQEFLFPVNPSTKVRFGRFIPCYPSGNSAAIDSSLRDIVKLVLGRLSFVNTETLLVARQKDIMFDYYRQEGHESLFFDASDYPFIERTMNYGAPIALAISLGTVILLRVALTKLLCNDLLLGIELLLRNKLMLPWGDSLLCFDQIDVPYERSDDSGYEARDKTELYR